MPGGQLLSVTLSFFQQRCSGGSELQGDGKHLLIPHTPCCSDISTLSSTPPRPAFQKGIGALSLGSFTFIWCCRCDHEKGSGFQTTLTASSPVVCGSSPVRPSPLQLSLLATTSRFLKYHFLKSRQKEKRMKSCVCCEGFDLHALSCRVHCYLHTPSPSVPPILPCSHVTCRFLLDIEIGGASEHSEPDPVFAVLRPVSSLS